MIMIQNQKPKMAKIFGQGSFKQTIIEYEQMPTQPYSKILKIKNLNFILNLIFFLFLNQIKLGKFLIVIQFVP